MGTTRGTTTCTLSNYESIVKTLGNIAGVDASSGSRRTLFFENLVIDLLRSGAP